MKQQVQVDTGNGTVTLPIKDYAALIEVTVKPLTEEERADTIFKLTNRIAHEAHISAGDFRTRSAIHDHISEVFPKTKLTYPGSPWPYVPHVFYSSGRGGGKTLRQMVSAPKGAYFVWCNDSAVWYAKDLAQYLGRDDLIIVGLSYLQDKNFRGRGPVTIVVDHAARITQDQYELCHWLLCNSYARSQT